MSGDFRTDNLMFPLCCLSFKIENLYDKLISYGIFNYSEYLKGKDEETGFTSIINYCDSLGEIDEYVSKNRVYDYDENDDDHKYKIIAGIKTLINFHNIETIEEEAEEIKRKVATFEFTYGKDAKVKIHNDLLFEVKDKKFDERLFRIYCAIKAIVGNKDLKRITIERIKYAMFGYKSKKVYETEIKNEAAECKRDKKYKSKIPPLLTNKQITLSTEKLRRLKLIDKFTYRKRATYYTTKPNLRGDKFAEKVAEFIAERRVKQEYGKIQREKIDKLIDKKFRKKMTEKINKELE